MKVIVAGSRSIIDATVIYNAIRFSGFEVTEIVSGLAKGVDTVGCLYAEENGLPVGKFPADWNTFGKSAGMIRNNQMADYADALVAVWDGVSPGTKQMINQMKKLGKPAYVWTQFEFQPISEGGDHVNIYSRSSTELGRALSNLARSSFTVPEYGKFESMEAYWYWLATGKKHDELRKLWGSFAKSTGVRLEKVYLDNFTKEVEKGLYSKLRDSPLLHDALLDCKLPLCHYYYYGDKTNPKIIRPKGSDFVAGFYEAIRQGTKHVIR